MALTTNPDSEQHRRHFLSLSIKRFNNNMILQCQSRIYLQEHHEDATSSISRFLGIVTIYGVLQVQFEAGGGTIADKWKAENNRHSTFRNADVSVCSEYNTATAQRKRSSSPDM